METRVARRQAALTTFGHVTSGSCDLGNRAASQWKSSDPTVLPIDWITSGVEYHAVTTNQNEVTETRETGSYGNGPITVTDTKQQ